MGCSKWVVLMFFILLENCWSSEGCREQEKVALLQLKHHPFNDSDIFQNWVERDENSDCCQWERVMCNNNTGRVIQLNLSFIYCQVRTEWYLNASLFSSFQELEWLDLSFNNIAGCIENEGEMRLSKLNNLKYLDLSNNRLKNNILSCLHGLSSLTTLDLSFNLFNGTINVKDTEWYLNASLFSSFQELEWLDLSFNNIAGCIENEGQMRLSRLNNLKYLNLSYNRLKNNFLSCLHGLSSLTTLGLRGNLLNGTINVKEIESLSNLEKLDLSFNDINKFGATKESINFTNLEVLILDGSPLHKSFLQSISVFNSLKHLSMRGCRLHGTFVLQGLCELVHLQELYLSNNYIRGTLPWCLANMTSLRVLDLSYNQITGNISLSPLRYLTSIEELFVSYNQFQIPISLEPFFNHSKLKRFYGDENHLYPELESHPLTPKFQLNYISLSGCRYNGTFPKFLHHQHELLKVDLSHINLRGEFPNWLLENNPNLQTLFLANNSLSGLFQMPVNPLKQLTVINVSSNFIQGHIPIEIGAFLPSLEDLNISSNAFTGSIPSSFGDISSLKSLDISYNQLTGEIPEHMAMGCFSLRILALSNNSLQGHIFSRNFNLTNLYWLQLDANQFTGGIPESLSNCSSLSGLYLSDNHISGQIPKWLGNFSYLEDFIMSKNHLQGPIPASLCKLNYLKVLDLEENNISGSLPSCFNSISISGVHLSRNRIEGKLGDAFRYSSFVVTLDLSYNSFSGRIPNWIDRLSDLNYLILANNNLEGEVPVQLCQMKKLRLIDLSHNNLSGKIPSCLDKTALSEGNSDAPATATAPSVSEAVMAIVPITGPPPLEKESVQFITKHNSYYYQGRILTNMFGLDLSCNKLTGEIPPQIGYLNRIRALNLSHNNLTGTIPTTFSHLNQIESLDLSYNILQGEIPPQLTVIDTLGVFSVAHNNLSGKIPYAAHLTTFDENSYNGNPFLCGLPLPKSCNENGSPRQLIPKVTTGNEEDDNLVDMQSFYITFAPSYVIVILGIIGVLYVNPYWRRRWFYLVDIWIASCYYFCVDHFISNSILSWK